MNKGKNKIGIFKKTRKKFYFGNEKVIDLVTRPINKFNNEILVKVYE